MLQDHLRVMHVPTEREYGLAAVFVILSEHFAGLHLHPAGNTVLCVCRKQNPILTDETRDDRHGFPLRKPPRNWTLDARNGRRLKHKPPKFPPWATTAPSGALTDAELDHYRRRGRFPPTVWPA